MPIGVVNLISTAYNQTPIEGFSGCFSMLELVLFLGFGLGDKKLEESKMLVQNGDCSKGLMKPVDSSACKASATAFHDLVVPNENVFIFTNLNCVRILLRC